MSPLDLCVEVQTPGTSEYVSRQNASPNETIRAGPDPGWPVSLEEEQI